MLLSTNLNTGADWATIIGGVIGTILFIITIIGLMFKARNWLDKKLTVNGGDTLTLGDTVGRIESKTDENRNILLYHLAHHPGPSDLPKDYVAPPPPRTEEMIPTRAELIESAPEGGLTR